MSFVIFVLNLLHSLFDVCSPAHYHEVQPHLSIGIHSNSLEWHLVIALVISWKWYFDYFGHLALHFTKMRITNTTLLCDCYHYYYYLSLLICCSWSRLNWSVSSSVLSWRSLLPEPKQEKDAFEKKWMKKYVCEQLHCCIMQNYISLFIIYLLSCWSLYCISHCFHCVIVWSLLIASHCF